MTHIRICGGKNGAVGDITRLLPHRPPFLLVDSVELPDRIMHFDGEESWPANSYAIGHCLVREENPFANESGELESVAFAEMLAQCAGALGLLQDAPAQSSMENAQPPLGYLAALRDVRILSKAHVGDALHMYVRRTTTIGQISVIEGKLFCGKVCLATAQLKIFVEERAHG